MPLRWRSIRGSLAGPSVRVGSDSFALEAGYGTAGLTALISPPTATSTTGQKTRLPPRIPLVACGHRRLARWRAADERAAGAILGVLGSVDISEPAVAAELGVLLPEKATLFVASSMSVREIETFWPVRGDPPRVLCNRGANGIDGTVSSAFGAAADTDGPVVLLIGDVALAYDIGGLLAAKAPGLEADDRAARQRRWRDLRFPTDRAEATAARRHLQPATSYSNQPRLRASRHAVRPGSRARGEHPRIPHRAGASTRVPDGLRDRAGADRPRKQRRVARPRLERRVKRHTRPRTAAPAATRAHDE